MTAYVKVDGSWKEVSPQAKINGEWKTLDSGYVKVSGVWKEFYQSFQFTVFGVNEDQSRIISSTDGITWTNNTINTDLDTRYQVAYGNGTFVSPITNFFTSAVKYSTNGIFWQNSGLPVANSWSIAGYGNGTFVVFSYSSTICAASTDAITWTQGTLPETGIWRSITYGYGRFAAVGSGKSSVFVSTNGISWTKNTIPISSNLNIIYANDKFLIVNGQSSATSTDTITWTQGTIPAAVTYSAYGNNVFVAIGQGTSNSAVSTNGIAWTQTTLPASATWRAFAFGNGIFMGIAYNSQILVTSTDGTNWTQRTLPASLPYVALVSNEIDRTEIVLPDSSQTYYYIDGDVNNPLLDGSFISSSSVIDLYMQLRDSSGQNITNLLGVQSVSFTYGSGIPFNPLEYLGEGIYKRRLEFIPYSETYPTSVSLRVNNVPNPIYFNVTS